MARPLRVEHEGAIYHILSRGNKAEFIFQDDAGKEYFLQVLEKAAQRFGIEVYCYCIMGNHYHLLIGVPLGMLSRVLHVIQSSFGSYLRREQKWIGHVFAGRYKSLCVEKQGYLLELSRYIHLNPVRAGIVKKPEEYSWSSYRFYAGKEKRPEWLKMEWLLQEYGKTLRIAQREYREFIEAGIKSSVSFPVDRVVGQAVLGRKEFIREVVKGIRTGKELKEVTSKRFFSKADNLDELYRAVCRHYQISEIVKGSEGGRSRDMFVYLAKRQTAALNSEIGQKAGGITFSAVAHRYSRTVRKMDQDGEALRQWEKEAEDILSRVKG